MKNIIITSVVGLVVVGGVLYFIVNEKPTSEQLQTQNQPQQENGLNNADSLNDQAVTSTTTSSMRQLLSGGSQKCSYTDAETAVSVILYVANGKMRTLSTTSNPNIKDIHSIINNNTMYLWFGDESTGMKYPYKLFSSAGSQSNNGTDLDKEIDFKCSSWTVDESLLVPPANVEFKELPSYSGNM